MFYYKLPNHSFFVIHFEYTNNETHVGGKILGGECFDRETNIRTKKKKELVKSGMAIDRQGAFEKFGNKHFSMYFARV